MVDYMINFSQHEENEILKMHLADRSFQNQERSADFMKSSISQTIELKRMSGKQDTFPQLKINISPKSKTDRVQ